jgi:peptide/nickel transport system ATP-binding protein
MINDLTQTTNGAPRADAALLEVRGLSKHFPIVRGIFGATQGSVKAVDNLSFAVRRGKTTAGRCIVRAYSVTAGEMQYHKADGTSVDLAAIPAGELGPLRPDIRMIFQDPHSSLNPRMTVFESVSEVLRVNRLCPPSELQDRVAAILRRVGLRPEYMQRYPHAFSGGERQRIVIARALITKPRLIVCDEAVSALDVSIRAQILNLLDDLQAELGLTYIFISHDLSVVRYICDRVVVMYVGKAVEVADSLDLYRRPRHPYSEALLASVPIPQPDGREQRKRVPLEGEIADPANPPSGCYFHPRCRFARPICKEQTPALRDVGAGHQVACHFAEELTLVGVSD